MLKKLFVFNFKYLLFLTIFITETLNAANFQESQLKNGLGLILFPSDKVPIVTIVLAAKAGAFTEKPETNGLTHLWEHMFFKGNASLKNQEAFQKRVRELGIIYNGTTSTETVKYFFSLPASELEAGLKFMSDAISTPKLDKDEMTREIKVVLDEYDRNASQPGFDLRNLVNKVIYGDLSYKMDALGERETIKSVTREILLKIKSEVFVPKNSAIFISGSFSEKNAKKLVNKYFGSWENPKDWKPQPPLKFQQFPSGTEIVVYDNRVRNPVVSLIFQGPNARENIEDTYVADMFINLLDQPSGTFYSKFIDSGLTLGAGVSYPTQKESGLLTLYAAVKAENLVDVSKKLLKEVHEWTKPGYFSKTQYSDAATSLVIDHQREVNRPSEFIKTLSYWWSITGLKYYANYQTEVAAVTEEKIIAFVKKYLDGKNPVSTFQLSPEDGKISGLKENSGPLFQKYGITRESK